MKYLRNKPARDLVGADFLRLVQAEGEGLLEMRIGIDLDQGAQDTRRGGGGLQSYFEEIRQLFYRVCALYPRLSLSSSNIINSRHACAGRVTVLGLSVSLCVCVLTLILALQATLRLKSNTNAFSAARRGKRMLQLCGNRYVQGRKNGTLRDCAWPAHQLAVHMRIRCVCT